MKKIILLAMLLTISFSQLSCATSFDCAKATSTTEKLICNNEALSKLDEQLASRYKQVLETATDKDAVKKQQIEWLKQQRVCKDADCLKQVYQYRIDELAGKTIEKKEQVVTASSSSSESNKPLTFTLTKGEGYPMCKQYVEMLNATKYPNKGTLACERKNLPNYPLFKSPQWSEIRDKNQMEKIIKERVTIHRAKSAWQKEQVDAEINNFMNYLKEDHLKIYSLKDDLDKDGIIDTGYEFEILYPVPDESKQCSYQTINYVDDGKTTVGNAKNMTDRDAIRYEGFNSSGHDKLFYYDNNIFSSSWHGGKQSNLVIWALDAHPICEISIH